MQDKHKIVFITPDPKVFDGYFVTNKSNIYELVYAKNIDDAKQLLTEDHYSAMIIHGEELPIKNAEAITKLLHTTHHFPMPILFLTTNDAPSLNTMNDLIYVIPVKEELANLDIVLKGLIHQNKVLTKSMNNAMKMFLTNQTMEEGKFKISEIEEAKTLSVFLGNLFANKQLASIGIFELILNAIEHGNYKIGHELKSQLIKENKWESEIKARKKSIGNKCLVEVLFKRTNEGNYIKVIDNGDGFDWRKYIDLDLSRYAQASGRGIALAKAQCFDKLVFNDKGNEVTAFSKHIDSFEW